MTELSTAVAGLIVVCLACLFSWIAIGGITANGACIRHFDHLSVVEANATCKRILEGTK